MNKTRSVIALFFLMFFLWLLASGHYTVMLISIGVLCCALVTALCYRMEIVDEEAVPVHLLGRALIYVPWIAWEVLKANVDVALRIIGIKDLNPELFEVPTSQRTDLGRVLYANSITLTPGTVSIMVQENKILVHAISDEVADGLKEGKMDQQVSKMEGA